MSNIIETPAANEVATVNKVATPKKRAAKKRAPKAKVETQEVETLEAQVEKKERAPRRQKIELVKEALCAQNDISEVQFLNFMIRKFQGKKVSTNKIAEILIERNLFDKEALVNEIKS